MKSYILKKGMRIMVYNDPRTKQKPEGIAILSNKTHMVNDEPLEYWIVKFLYEHGRYSRWIDPADVIKNGRE
jgi:alpha-glucosidase (family GH31 glycosyl hydrolase)